jgi:ABC-type multidrug transport system fused ATPase/permease subunit
MFKEKVKRKAKTLFQVLSFVYSRFTWQAILRDILFVISTASDIYSISILGKFIDATADILLLFDTFQLSEYVSSESFFYLATILVLWMISQICNQGRLYLYTVIYEGVWSEAKDLMIQKVSKSNLQDVEKTDFQNLLTFIPAYSIERLVTAYDDFSNTISNLVRLVSTLFILFATMSWSVLLLVAFVLPEIVFVHLKRKKIRQYQDDEVSRFRKIDYLAGTALDVSIFPELRVDGVFSFLKRKFRKEYDKFLGGYLERQYEFYENKILYSLIDQALKFGYVIYLLAFSITKKVSLGTFKALYDYVDVAYNSAYQVLNSFSLLSTNMDYIDDFFELINYEGFGDREHGQEKLPKNKVPVLEFQNLDFAYPDDPSTKVLNNVSFEVKPGEKVALFGGDSSGKSSLVKVMTGLYEIVAGDFVVGGYSVRELDRGELKKKIAVTFQNFINYSFSIKENIIIGANKRKNINNSLYEEVKEVSGVAEFMKEHHMTDDTLLGRNFAGGIDLSPGYWQRIAIARMLYRNRDIFILDEPLTFIDAQSRNIILKNVIDFAGEDRTVIYLTADTDNLDLFDKIYYFEKGKIVEAGNWNELMKKKGLLYKQAKFNK